MITLIEFIVGYNTIEVAGTRRTSFYDFFPFSKQSVYFKPLNLLRTLSHSEHRTRRVHTSTKCILQNLYKFIMVKRVRVSLKHN